MIERGTVDRFEEEWAILLIGDDLRQIEVSRELIEPQTHEGDHVQIEWQDDKVVAVMADNEATEQARLRIQNKLERLRRGDHLAEDDA